MLGNNSYAHPARLLAGGLALLASAILSLSLSSCRNSSENTPAPTVKLATDTPLGPHLVDAQGYTIYYFTRDLAGTNNCTGGCITTWPVYFDTIVNLPSALKSTDFGVITRADGPGGTSRQQATYKGLPLYYYAPDAATRNAIGGDGIGNIWSVATL